MIEKIQLLMKIHQMSAADLAEKLGTERSGISHFLSGRNKPSLAFVQKLLENFPELNPDWLLLDNGSMLRTDTVDFAEKTIVSNAIPELQFPEQQVVKEVAQVHDEDPIQYNTGKKQAASPASEEQPKVIADDESIDRIVIFYQNGTFKAYRDI